MKNLKPLVDSGTVGECPVCHSIVHIWLDGVRRVFDWHDKALLTPCYGRPMTEGERYFEDKQPYPDTE